MPRLEARWSGAEADPDLFRPRRDLVLEAEDGPGRFVQAEGPFQRYERQVQAEADGSITETTSYRLAIPWFGWVFALPTRRSLQRAPSHRPHGGRSRGGRRRSASTRGRPTCSGCSPRRS